ncbi:hypothetical protein Lal_00040826 [Lupinus albus]|uniref:Auxin-induced protein n=1 Tax=Lupinus albus TaxID=3870 RepID=A0A6A5NI82_LUPAL|nr:putative transcription factor interactor and regulator AUX-IAA family [Lupinus albus]KAF1887226.1 hypothetical protein Lal_00040826 [Lupinus albus]
MELQLGLALPTQPLNHNSSHSHNKKRSFSNLFHHHTYNNTEYVMLPTLSLLPLTPSQSSNLVDPLSTKNDGNDVVGWPPVNSYRKKLRHDNYGDDEAARNYKMVWIHHQPHTHVSVGARECNSLYVKVKMEGVGIARKINLTKHHSFQTLKETLMDMFGKCGHRHSKLYELAYQDQEGDWLLADDVPWRNFIECAKQLKLVKNIR